MTRLAMPVTKSNLLRLRGDLLFLRAGRDLLDQKREFLSDALSTFERDAQRLRANAESKLAAAYELLAEAHAAHGADGLASLALGADPLAPIDVRERSLMGVVVPMVRPTAESSDSDAPSGLRAAAGASGLAADAAAAALRAILPALLELAELESSCLRLAHELQAVRRKLNALEVVHIPAHRETIRFIADQLEEREREQLFQLKRIRALEESAS